MRLGWAVLSCVSAACVVAGCAGPRRPAAAPPAAREAGEERELTPNERRKVYALAYERGLALAERGEVGVAVECFSEALRLDPGSTEARLGLGACYESMGDPIRAVREYRSILAVRPDDADAYANLGTSYIKLYHREKNEQWLGLAREAWSRSLRLRPDQPDVRGYLAMTGGS